MDKYAEILEELESLEEIERLSGKFSVPQAVLEAILSQEVVERTRSRFSMLPSSREEILSAWEDGKSIVEIAEDLDFPPVMVARELLQALGYSKKAVKLKIKDPAGEDGRLRKEIEESAARDFVYSPQAHELQDEKASTGERLVGRWLRNVKARVVDQGDRRTKLSPDFLVSGLELLGFKIKWLESKALFGSEREHSRYFKRQYSRYLESFGSGLVVYWYGFEGSIVGRESNILLLDYTFFEREDVEELFTLTWGRYS